jgi:tetratricopeptide (TPR) repeat protein
MKATELNSSENNSFLATIKLLHSEGLVAAQTLSATFDRAGQSDFLEADLIAGAKGSAPTSGQRGDPGDGVMPGHRYLRCALFSRACGHNDAYLELLRKSALAFAPEAAIGWAIWLREKLDDSSAALALMLLLATQHTHDARTQWQISCALSTWPEEAARTVRRTTLTNAWRLNPSIDPALPLQLALAMRSVNDWVAVEQVCRTQLANNPRDMECAWQLANAQWQRHDPVAAEATMRAVQAVKPKHARSSAAIALFTAEQARYSAARRLYERALALDPSDASAAVDLAELELRDDEWKRGWSRYELRLKRTDRAPNSAVSIMRRVAPYWTGQSLKGRTLLVYSEQGNGDDIQMLRFIPILAEQVRSAGGQLVLVCRRSLHSLVSRFYEPCVRFETGEFAMHGAPDYCLSIMSVPFMLQLKPGEVRGIPYLRPSEERGVAWHSQVREATPSSGALQIGLVWRGNATHRRDAQRSMPMEEISPLFGLPNIVFHPLTPGHQALPATTPQCNLANTYQQGFDDVAAHVSVLDAIVTIDSAPLHLGGALGVPVLAMLDHVSQWCWGKFETQRWYDSVALFRQPEPGKWQPVVARVAERLQCLATQRKQKGRTFILS